MEEGEVIHGGSLLEVECLVQLHRIGHTHQSLLKVVHGWLDGCIIVETPTSGVL